ncbi:MAG: porin [Sutterella sp.]|nr:porin [Sutterella sp.]
MKKTLIAVAALSAMAASAMAANVTVYGKIDQGLQIQSQKTDGLDRTTTWQGVSGVSSGSRWGLKGTEEIADGYTVGFVLESGFDGMTGKSGQGSRLFGRDAFVTLGTPFGSLTVGRTGMLSDGCTGDIVSGPASPFGTSYGIAAATTTSFVGLGETRTDRAVRYVSPKFAGVQFHAEYANMNGEATASTKKRYGGVGVSYANGPFYAAIAAETIKQAAGVTADDPQIYSIAANYDFGVAKVFGGYQYAKDSVWGGEKLNAGTLGVSAPVAGGTVMASIAYAKGDNDRKLTTGAIGYKYSLSKRTYIYTDLAYAQEDAATTEVTTKTTQFNVGLCHNF